ncbi:sulfiredoxin-1 [Ixodes scapularis]|nr:sulfiredoxin-1 [Ixodes scapularis]
MAEHEGMTEGVDAHGKTVLYLDFNSFVTAAGPGNMQNVVIVNSGTGSSNSMSVHTANISKVHDVPLDDITRPLPVAHYDEDKVRGIVEVLQNPATKDQVPPIDLLWVKGSQGGNYYYSFGGNHRLEAHYRMGCTTIRAKLIQATPLALASYLGGSTPDLK